MSERDEVAGVPIEKYFKVRPLALSVALAIVTEPAGMTATQLAETLSLSVPKMQRLTREMSELGLLKAKRKGEERVFQVAPSVRDRILEITPELWRAGKNDSVERALSAAKTLIDELRVPLSPRYMSNMLKTALRRRVHGLLPEGMRRKRTRLRFIFGEIPKFDLVLGDDEVTIAVEIRILDSPRNVFEAVGAVASLASHDIGLDTIIPVFLLLPVSIRGIDSWPVDSEEILEILNPLSRDVLRMDPIVEMVEPEDLADSSFRESLAQRIAGKLQDAMKKSTR